MAALLALAFLALAPPSIRIGACFNLSGDLEVPDVSAYAGFRLAAARLNARGGVLGRQIEVVASDFHSNARAAGLIMDALLKKGVVATGGFTEDEFAYEAGRVANRHRIPFVTSGASSPRLPVQVGQWYFMACAADDDQGRAGAGFAFTHLKAKTAVVLRSLDSPTTRDLADGFAARFKQLGGKVLQSVDFHDEEPIVEVASRIRSEAALIYCACHPDDAPLFIKRLREAGRKAPILSGDGFEGLTADNLFHTTHYAEEPSEAGGEFRRFYTELYGDLPSGPWAALGYDTLSLIADAIRRAKSTEPAKMRFALANTRSFRGVTGTISYAPGRRQPTKPIFIMRVREGKASLVATIN